MNIILINTTTPQAYVALLTETQVIAEHSWTADATLGQKLLTTIDELLKQVKLTVSDIHRIAVHTGPGHFGGLRTAITTATMLSQTTNADLVEVNATEPT